MRQWKAGKDSAHEKLLGPRLSTVQSSHCRSFPCSLFLGRGPLYSCLITTVLEADENCSVECKFFYSVVRYEIALCLLVSTFLSSLMSFPLFAFGDSLRQTRLITSSNSPATTSQVLELLVCVLITDDLL